MQQQVNNNQQSSIKSNTLQNINGNNSNNNNNSSQLQPKCTYESLHCILQNIKIEDQQENFQDSSQELSKDENKLNEAVFQTDSSVNLQSSFNLNDENIYSNANSNKNQQNNKFDKKSNDKNIFNSSFMSSSQINNQTYQQDKKSQDSCSILADLQFEQKQSKYSNSFTNINDSKSSNNKNFHKKSVSQNIPKLDLSGISIQNNNYNTTNLQSNINFNNSMILNDQISESPIQTEKNQTTKNLRYEEEQTERKNNKVQQESSLKDQNDWQSNQQDKFEIKQNKNLLILHDSPSSFNSQSDFKCDANNSFLTDKQNVEQQQIKTNLFVNDFNVSDLKLPQLQEEKTEVQNKNQDDKLKQKQNQQVQIIPQFNQNCKNSSNQNLQFYKQDYLQTNQNNFDKFNVNNTQNIQDAKLKPNQSKLGLFIDSFNELFNSQNNIHTQVDSPKVAFDTFNNSLAPNHDDYSNIKQEITNFPTIEYSQTSDQKLNYSQNILGNFQENQKKNLYQTDYQSQMKSNNPKNVIQPQCDFIQNNLTADKLFIANKNEDQLFKSKTQIQSVQIENLQNQEGLTYKHTQLSKQNKQQTQQNNCNNSNKIQSNYFISSNCSEQHVGKNSTQLQIAESKQAQEVLQQKNIQSIFSRKRVLSDHDKVKKDFEQVLNENNTKEKSIDPILKNKKGSVSVTYQNMYQQNANKSIYDKNQQTEHQTSYLIHNRESIGLSKDFHIAKLDNTTQNLVNNTSQFEQQIQEYQETNQMLYNCEENLKIVNVKQKKRATTTDDGAAQKIKFQNDDANKLKKQIVNFTQKKMIENEMKTNKGLIQENNLNSSKDYQNHESLKQMQQENSTQQEFMKKENDFDVHLQNNLPQKQHKFKQNGQFGINKPIEHGVNNGVKIHKFKQDNLTPSNNSGSNYFLSSNSQVSRIEQNKRLHIKQLSNSFQVGLTNNVNKSFTTPFQYQQTNSSQVQYKDNEMYKVINKVQGINEEQTYSCSNFPYQNEYNIQKQAFQNKNKQSIIENNSNNNNNNQEFTINLSNITFEGTNNQDGIKKISGNGAEKKKPMRATPLNQPIMDLSTVNNPPQFQNIKCQPLSTPNYPNRDANFSHKTKILHIRQGDYHFKKSPINQQSSPQNIFYLNNKENITDMNIQIEKIKNDLPYADQSYNLQGISPSEIVCKPFSNSGQKKSMIESNNFSQNILQDQSNIIQNLSSQNKIASKKQQQQNNINNQPQKQQKQQQISATMRHKRNQTMINTSCLLNQQQNIMKNQQNYRSLNQQQIGEYEQLLQQQLNYK
ncbi:hypothetical protein ABPG74_000101 [Tetrahymena malaccensis]